MVEPAPRHLADRSALLVLLLRCRYERINVIVPSTANRGLIKLGWFSGVVCNDGVHLVDLGFLLRVARRSSLGFGIGCLLSSSVFEGYLLSWDNKHQTK